MSLKIPIENFLKHVLHTCTYIYNKFMLTHRLTNPDLIAFKTSYTCIQLFTVFITCFSSYS
jgi:hypothetical protein